VERRGLVVLERHSDVGGAAGQCEGEGRLACHRCDRSRGVGVWFVKRDRRKVVRRVTGRGEGMAVLEGHQGVERGGRQSRETGRQGEIVIGGATGRGGGVASRVVLPARRRRVPRDPPTETVG